MGRSAGALGGLEQHGGREPRALVGRFSASTAVYFKTFDMNGNDRDHGRS